MALARIVLCCQNISTVVSLASRAENCLIVSPFVECTIHIVRMCRTSQLDCCCLFKQTHRLCRLAVRCSATAAAKTDYTPLAARCFRSQIARVSAPVEFISARVLECTELSEHLATRYLVALLHCCYAATSIRSSTSFGRHSFLCSQCFSVAESHRQRECHPCIRHFSLLESSKAASCLHLSMSSAPVSSYGRTTISLRRGGTPRAAICSQSVCCLLVFTARQAKPGGDRGAEEGQTGQRTLTITHCASQRPTHFLRTQLTNHSSNRCAMCVWLCAGCQSAEERGWHSSSG